MTEVKSEPVKPHPYDLFVNEKKAPQWVANFDVEDRREQYAEDVSEGRTLIRLLVGIACIGLILGIVVMSYMFFGATS